MTLEDLIEQGRTLDWAETAIVLLTRGLVAIVDRADLPLAVTRKWQAYRGKHTWYAGARGGLYLHRVIVGAPQGQQVDHVNGDGLDCRRSNLRLATQSQNNANARKRSTAKWSMFKGVDRQVRKKTPRSVPLVYWRARVRCAGLVRAAYFKTEAEAAAAYSAMARSVFGEFARGNEP